MGRGIGLHIFGRGHQALGLNHNSLFFWGWPHK